MTALPLPVTVPDRKIWILFLLFCLTTVTMIPAPCTALVNNDEPAGYQVTTGSHFFPSLPVYIAPLQVATKAPVNVSTTAVQYTFQTVAPANTPAPVATSGKPVLQTTPPVPVRTASTTILPPFSMLQTWTLATSVTKIPSMAPAPSEDDCPPGLFYCNGNCIVDSHGNCGGCGIACRPDQVCVNSHCSCGRDSSLCNGVCIPTHNDAANCGGCNIRCPSNQICSNSICTCPFETGMKFCNGTCIRTGNDTQNCGECGRHCGAGQGCVDSDCITHCNGAVTNVDENSLHCGSCGHACAADEWCSEGVCTRIPCPYGTLFCNGECVRILENPQNCGACNRPCTYPNRICFSGQCMPACPPGWSDCDEDGYCEDLNTGSGGYYCGSCNTMCRWNEVCYGGGCHGSCPAGQTICNRACFNLMNNPDHCGDCDHQCTNTQICESGYCVAPCPEGSQRCHDTCMDWTGFYFDNNNCGTCGNQCTVLCAMGTCMFGWT